MMRSDLLIRLSLALFVAAISPAKVLSQEGYKLLENELRGSKILIAVPEEWNGKALLLAHGYVPEEAPLIANFYPNPSLYDDLIEKGWLVAATSYRRNGLIIQDGVEDIENLRQFIIEEIGEPQMAIVQGSSMGGVIGTLIAEGGHPGYHGVLNMGAALHIQDSLAQFEIQNKPLIPVLFLTNQSEDKAPRAYVKTASTNNDLAIFWLVQRDGHVNINGAEQFAALSALVSFIESGPVTRDKNATVVPRPISKARFTNEGAYTKISWIDPVYGNLYTVLTKEDMDKLDIPLGKPFRLRYRGETFVTLYGTTYNDVPVGDWVAFVSGDGTIQISCNYKNAQRVLDCSEGDELLILK